MNPNVFSSTVYMELAIAIRFKIFKKHYFFVHFKISKTDRRSHSLIYLTRNFLFSNCYSEVSFVNCFLSQLAIELVFCSSVLLLLFLFSFVLFMYGTCIMISIYVVHYFLGDGVSIPLQYSSYLAPLSAPKLYSSIEDCRERDKVHA